MCGIAGLIKKSDRAIDIRGSLASFRHSLRHRGPDDSGEFIADHFGVTHCRLSIVDRAGGHQPIFSEDKNLGIVYNGEVYNYKVLREDLKKKGYSFYTNTDTEVILKAFQEYGPDSFDKLNGMFAFCIWNLKEKVIFLVRDCFGIKPLYIYEDQSQLIFSSELKGILGIGGLELAFDPSGFQDYLFFRYIQAPYTLFGKVRRLEAGTYLKIHNGKTVQHRYADISYKEPYAAPEMAKVKDELLERLQQAVRSQLMGEVPIGVLLSGGVDSSALAYFVHKNGADLTTFNIGFPDVNEFKYSREVARKYGLKHVEVLTTTEELVGNLDEIMLALDEPIADTACFPLYILARELKKHVTVVLSGEGGDELFAGYPQYSALLRENVPYSQRFEYFLQESWYFRNYLDFLNDPSIPPHTTRYGKYFEEQPLLNGMLSYDMKTWMPENLMMKADKIMMAHSLEGRFPFLDKEVFEYAAHLPQDYKYNSQLGVSKWILKESMKPHLPKGIINRPKMGFTVPVDALVQNMKTLILDTCSNAVSSGVAAVLNMKFLQAYVESYFQNRKAPALQIWTLFVLLYWLEKMQKTQKIQYNSLPRYEMVRNCTNREPARENPFQARDEIRYEVTKPFLQGNGIEIGAGIFPSLLPEKAVCEYFDIRNIKELSDFFKTTQHDLKDVYPMDVLHARFPSGSDFLIAHNVLEHSPNPIQTLVQWHGYVKDGGVMVLSVPDTDFEGCPDRGRLIPPFEHILMDYLLNGNHKSFESREHVYSFLMGEGWLEEGMAKGKDKFEVARIAHEVAKGDANDLHWHALDKALFQKIIGLSAVLSSCSVQLLASATPGHPTSPTNGEIIYVYRIARKSDDDSSLKELHDEKKRVSASISTAIARLARIGDESLSDFMHKEGR